MKMITDGERLEMIEKRLAVDEARKQYQAFRDSLLKKYGIHSNHTVLNFVTGEIREGTEDDKLKK